MTSRRKKRRREPWGEFEDLALKEFYPRHGPSWVGWDEVLPDRTRRAISCRANKLEIRAPSYVPPPRDKGDEYDQTIDRLMAQGMTPTQIDAMMHWVPQTTMNTLKERWRNDSDN